MAIVAYPGTPGTVIYGGLPTPTGGTALTTITLANTSATEQAAGFVSPMFGLPLKQGDVPAGQYPAFFLADDTPVPATVYADTSWPDASKKFCGAFARVPASVPGSGSLAITVKNGGSAPSASSRTLSDLTAADLKVELTGVTNLSGVWTASLNDAITAATDIVVIGDGPAGKVWRIGGPFKQSGSAHAHLYCTHYIAAMEGASGELIQIRYLAYFGQKWGDVAATDKTYRDCTGVVKSGASVIHTITGSVTRTDSTTQGPVSNTFRISYWASAFAANSDGTWLTVSGSASTIRCIQDASYVRKSLVVPNYPISLASVQDAPSVGYSVNCLGAHETYAMSGTAERDSIGLAPKWCAAYWNRPNAVNERAMRVSALAAAGYGVETFSSATKRPMVNQGTTNWTGLGTTTNAWRRWGDTEVSGGIVAPVGNQSSWQTDTAHRPAPIFSAYIATGEPQYLDMMIGAACGHAFNISGDPSGYLAWYNTRPRSDAMLEWFGTCGTRVNNDPAKSYPAGGLLLRESGIRQGAWAFRDVAQTLAVLPDTQPDGADYKGYLSYIVTNCASAFLELCSGQPTGFRDDGLFVYTNKTQRDSCFQHHYLDLSIANASALLPQFASLASLREYLGRKAIAINAKASPELFEAYDLMFFDEGGLISSGVENLLFEIGPWNTRGALSFSTSTNRVTSFTGPAGVDVGPDWAFKDGDQMMFLVSTGMASATRPYDEITDYRRFYVVNATPANKSFQLSLTPGGAPLTIVRDFTFQANGSSYFCQIKEVPLGFRIGAGTGADGYLAQWAGAVSYHAALGSEAHKPIAQRLRASFDVWGDARTSAKYEFQETLPE